MTYLLMECVSCSIRFQACVYVCRLLVVSLGPYLVLDALFTFWQRHLRLFKIRGFCLSLLQWGALDFPNLSLDETAWTLLQWLQHLWLVFRVFVLVLVTIFANRGCPLLMVFKWWAVVANGLEICRK